MTKINKLYYFAYGSNMSVVQLFSRIGTVKEIGKKVLHGYRIRFNCGLSKKRCFANIEEGSIKDFVVGVLYEISYEQLNILNLYEAFYDNIFFKEEDKFIVSYISKKETTLKNDGNITDEYKHIIKQTCLKRSILSTLKKLP